MDTLIAVASARGAQRRGIMFNVGSKSAQKSTDDMARIRLSARSEALVRALLKTANVDVPSTSSADTKLNQNGIRKVYDSLLSQGFRVVDVEEALRATGRTTEQHLRRSRRARLAVF